jgi:GT2 family glycosyltransferase
MALIAMAVYDTEENNRTEYTKRTIHSLMQTVNMAKHRIHVIDNASCKATKKLLQDFAAHITIHTNGQNLGTAKAVNIAWKERQPGEHCVKMDNDVVIHQKDWCDDLEKAIELDPKIGIVGLKRKDCWENPNHEQLMYRSELKLLGGGNNKWLPIEKVNHVMGTCQMYNSDLLDKIGYLYQPRLYGFDDIISAIRCHIAGFYSCFLPHIDIDHIDTGGDEYTTQKQDMVQEQLTQYYLIRKQYLSGQRDIYTEANYKK